MMSDYSRTQELLGDAQNSSGAAQEQYDKTLESLDSKLNILKDTWDEFVMGIANSDGIKFAVDLLNKVLEIINKLTTDVPVLSQALKGLMAIGIWQAGGKLVNSIVKITSASTAGSLPEELFGDIFKDKSMLNVGLTAGKTLLEGLKQGILSANGKGLGEALSDSLKGGFSFLKNLIPTKKGNGSSGFDLNALLGDGGTQSLGKIAIGLGKKGYSYEGGRINFLSDLIVKMNEANEAGKTLVVTEEELRAVQALASEAGITLSLAEESVGEAGLIASLSQLTLAGVVEKLKASFASLWTLLLTNPFVQVAAALAAVFAAFKIYEKWQQSVIDKASEIKEAYEDVNSTVQENKATLSSVSEEFKKLSRGVDDNGNNIGLSTEEYERYLEISNQLAEMSPSIIQRYDEEGNAIIDKKNALSELNEEQERNLEMAKKDMASLSTLQGFYETLRKDGNLINEYSKLDGLGANTEESLNSQLLEKQKSLTNKKKYHYKLKMKGGDTSAIDNQIDQIEEEIQDLQQDKAEYLEKITAYSDVINSLTFYAESLDGGQYYSENYSEIMSSAIKEIAVNSGGNANLAQEGVENLVQNFKNHPEILSAYTKMISGASELQKKLDKGEISYNNYNSEIENYTKKILSYAEELQKSGDATQKALGEALEKSAKAYENYASEAEISLEDALNPLKEQISAARELSDTLDGLSETDYYASANSISGSIDTALNEENTQGYGSKTFWGTAKEVLDSDKYEKYYSEKSAGKAAKAMQRAQSWFEEGSAGAINFVEDLKSLEGVTYNAETGNLNLGKWTAEKIAKRFGVSKTILASAQDKTSQYFKDGLSLSDPNAVQNALNTDEGVLRGEKESKSDNYNSYLVSKQYLQELESATGLGIDQIEEEIKKIDGATVVDFNKAKNAVEKTKEFQNFDNSNNSQKVQGAYATAQQLGANENQTIAYLEEMYSNDYLKNWDDYEGLFDGGKVNTESVGYQQLMKEYSSAIGELDYMEGIDSKIDTIISLMPGGKKALKDYQNSLDSFNIQSSGSDSNKEESSSTGGGDSNSNKDDNSNSNKDNSESKPKKKTTGSTIEYSGIERSSTSYTNPGADTGGSFGGTTAQAPNLTGADIWDRKLREWLKDSFSDGASNELRQEHEKATSGTSLTSATKDIQFNSSTGFWNLLKKIENIDIGENIDPKATGEVRTNSSEANDKIFSDLKERADIEATFSLNATDEQKELLQMVKDGNTQLQIQAAINEGNFNPEEEPWKTLLNSGDKELVTKVKTIIEDNGETSEEGASTTIKVKGDLTQIKQQIASLGTSSVVISPNINGDAISSTLQTTISSAISRAAKTTSLNPPVAQAAIQSKIKSAIRGVSGKVNITPHLLQSKISVKSGKGTATIGLEMAARGQNLAGSAAKGAKRGKIGPRGKGGLTLTGELGPELVWLPNESQSFLTGIDGPEMQNLPSNAVVWPHDQTKKIMNSSARGQNFGSLGGGIGFRTGSFLKAYSSASSSSSSGGTNTNTSSKKTKKSSSKKKSDKWENSIDKWYNNSVKAEKYLRQAERLQDEYDDYLSDLSKSADYMKEYTKQQLTFYKAVIAESQAAMKTINGLATSYKKGNNTKYYYTNSKGKKKSFNAQTYAYWDDNLKMVQINWEKINKVSNEELGSAIEEYLQKLEKYQSEYEAYQDKVTDALDSIKEMADNLRDGSIDWIDDVRSAIEYEIQTQIDTASSLNETIEDSNSKLMDSLNNAISKSRQERENKDTEKDIADKRAQLAALQRDTSGSNATKIKQLQEEIKDAEQDYTDSLVDQKLDEMQDAMDEAADQRSQMIDILERQLDWQKNSGILSQMAWDKIQNMDSESLLNYVLNNSEDYKQGSSYEKEEDKEEKSGHQKQFTNASTTQMTSTTGNNGLNTKGAQYTQYETLGDEVGTGKLTGTAQLGDNAINYKITQVEKNGQTGFYETTEASKTVLQNGSNLKGLQVYNSKGESIMTLSDSAKLSDDGTTITDGKSKITGVTIQNGQLVTNNAKQKNKAGYQKGYLKEAAKLKKSSKNIAKRNTLIKKAVRNMIDYGTISYKGLSSGDTLKAGEAQKLRPVLGLKKLKKAARFSYAESQKLKNNKKFSGFKTGGLADYTGTAWLDGTPSKPELVLNAEDTKNFIQLKDILSSAFSGTNSSTSSMGDNYYEISINVDKMNSDYDVEQVANKIKKMIVNDAKYRGVTSVRRSK